MNNLYVHKLTNVYYKSTISWEYLLQVYVLKYSKPYPHNRNITGDKSEILLYSTKVPFSCLGNITIDNNHYVKK